MEKKTRNSNVELLRIIAMLFIISHHYLHHGFLGAEFYNANQYLIQIFKIGGALGVDIFFIISGYYMYKSKFTIKKMLKLEGEVLFYSIVLWIIVVVSMKKYQLLDIDNCLKFMFPTAKGLYWFFTTYTVLMIFSKYINKFVDSLDKTTFRKLLFILAIIDFILPTYFKVKLDNIFLDKACALYLVGVYINKYNVAKSENIKIYKKKVCLYFILQTAITIFAVYFKHITQKYLMNGQWYFVEHTNPLVALIAIYMFLIFISLPPMSSKAINKISSTVFGVYLIHEHLLVRPIIWSGIINCKQYYDKPYMIINCIGVSVAIFITCSIIDFIRINTVEKLYMKVIDKVIEKVKSKKKKKLLLEA